MRRNLFVSTCFALLAIVVEVLVGLGCGGAPPRLTPAAPPVPTPEIKEIDVGPEHIAFAKSPGGAPQSTFEVGDPIYARIEMRAPLAEKAGFSDQTATLSVSVSVVNHECLRDMSTKSDTYHAKTLDIAIVRAPEAPDDPIDFDASSCARWIREAIAGGSKTVQFQVEARARDVLLATATFSIAIRDDAKTRLAALDKRYEQNFASRRLPPESRNNPYDRVFNEQTLEAARRYLLQREARATALRAIRSPGLRATVALKLADARCVTAEIELRAGRPGEDPFVVQRFPELSNTRRIACERITEAEEEDRRVFENRRLPESHAPELEALAIAGIRRRTYEHANLIEGGGAWDRIARQRLLPLRVALDEPRKPETLGFLNPGPGRTMRTETGRLIHATAALRDAEGIRSMITLWFWQRFEDGQFQDLLDPTVENDIPTTLPCANVTSR